MNYTEEMLDRIDRVLENEEAVRAIQVAKTEEDIMKIVSTYGAEVDFETAQEIIERLNKFREDGELTEEELEMVAGGKKTCKKRMSENKKKNIATAVVVGCALLGGIAGGPLGALAAGAAASGVVAAVADGVESYRRVNC